MMPIPQLRFPRSLLAAAVAGLLFTGSVLAQSTAPLQPVERIAAVVNEDVILRSELERAVANVRTQFAGRENQLPPAEILERQVLERLVLMRLQVTRATDAGITTSEQEVEGTIQGIAQQNGMTLEQLRQRVVEDGMTWAGFRSNLRDEIMTQKLRQSFAQSRINVSEAEVDAAMTSAMASGAQQFHLAHILVATPESPTPEQIAIAQRKIDGVKGLIDKGEMSFAAAAVRYSDSPNALEGGDLGWRSLNEIPPAFAATIQQLQAGQMIGPIRGPSGFQLLQLVETRSQAVGAEQVTQFSARQILVRVDEDTDEAAAQAKAQTLSARLAGGADFAKLAAEASDDTTTQRRGGDLGWFSADTYGTAFGMQVAALSDGQASAPFRSDEGWVIVQRTGSRQVAAADQNLRAQVRDTIGRRKLEEEWNRWLREMRGEAYVDVRGQAGSASGG